MSHSKEERQANVNLAIELLFERLGNQWIREVYFDSNDGALAALYPTTWLELTERYYFLTQEDDEPTLYQLTTAGWVEGLKRKQLLNHPDFLATVGELCSALKRSVKGRSEDALVEFDEIVKETKLPKGLLCNIIDADIIDYELKRYGAKWRRSFEGRLLDVPLNFGLEWL